MKVWHLLGLEATAEGTPGRTALTLASRKSAQPTMGPCRLQPGRISNQPSMVSSLIARPGAQLWDEGCRRDKTRNIFIIPQIVRILAAEMPGSVLDIGSGTGHIAREVNRLLVVKPEWTLLDINRERLRLADQLKPAEMRQETLFANICGPLLKKSKFDAALAIFTLLEMHALDAFAKSTWSLLNDRAILLVAMPDAWTDVLAEAKSNPAVLSEFMDGRASICKIDKFTQSVYPFHAVRIENLLQIFLSRGFHLCELVRSPDKEAFMLVLRRCLEELPS